MGEKATLALYFYDDRCDYDSWSQKRKKINKGQPETVGKNDSIESFPEHFITTEPLMLFGPLITDQEFKALNHDIYCLDSIQ